jgi:hypothetical protein
MVVSLALPLTASAEDYSWSNSGVKKIVMGTGDDTTAGAALKEDGSVWTWGEADAGGDSSKVADQLRSGVKVIAMGGSAGAALKDDGSVVAWGHSFTGGDSCVFSYDGDEYLCTSVAEHLQSGVKSIVMGPSAAGAIKEDGSAITWGFDRYGGDSSKFADQLKSGVKKLVFGSEAGAALKEDGSVYAWGGCGGGDTSYHWKGTPSADEHVKNGVQDIFLGGGSGAALKEDGSVWTWGCGYAGDSTKVGEQLTSGVK